MAQVTVTPETFNYVTFDHARIVELVEEVADVVGLPVDAALTVAINEATPLARVKVESIDPIVLAVEGGAFENAKRPRSLSEDGTRSVLARVLFKIRDRRDPAFGDPPPDGTIPVNLLAAWDAYCEGRAQRGGLPVKEPRRRYHFRNRHGFTDVADAVFDRLWRADALTWADLEAACEETAAARATA